MKLQCFGEKTSLFSLKSLNLSKFIYEVEIYFNFKKITDCRVIIRFVNFLLFQLCNETVMLLATEVCLITSIFIFKRIIISIGIKSNSILVCIFSHCVKFICFILKYDCLTFSYFNWNLLDDFNHKRDKHQQILFISN